MLKRRNSSISWLIAALLFVSQTGSFALAQIPQAPEFISFSGRITELPDDSSFIGQWLVEVAQNDPLAESQSEFKVNVTADTGIIGQSPEINLEATVRGFLNDDDEIDAIVVELIRIPDGDFDFSDFTQDWIHLNGTVLTAPTAADGIGQWQVSDTRERTFTITVSEDTDISEVIPSVGDRVFVSGSTSSENNVLADEFVYAEDPSRPEPEEGSWGVFEISGIVEDIERLDADDEEADPTCEEDAEDCAENDGVARYSEQWLLHTPSGQTEIVVDESTNFVPERANVGDQVQIWGYVGENDQYEAIEIVVDRFVANEIVVRLEQNVDPAVIAERYGLTAGAVRLGSGGIYQYKALNPRVSATQRILNQMQVDEDVVWAERNFTGELPVEGKPFGTWAWGGNDDTQYTSQAAYEQINLAAAHTRAQGDNIVIAVLDTGVDLKHPALTEHLVSGWDMLDDDAIPQDEGSGVAYGHGSHVSGIVAQVAPNSLIMPIRVLDSNGLGDSFILAYAIDWATEQGADVINLSLGMTEYSRVLHQAVRDATNAGVVIVGAAGNRSTAELNYPAAFPQVIGVTAVDGENQLASFANYGPSASIAAPGVGIRSTIPTASGPGYASWSGTSMAAPFVSGAAALVRQLNSNSSSQDVTSTLVTSGSTVSTQAENGNIPLVWPLLNAGAAVGASNTGSQPDGSPTTPSNPNPDPNALTLNLFLPLVQQ